nr:CehA/McbA family metallohydrolase [Evansella caseinilytica]
MKTKTMTTIYHIESTLTALCLHSHIEHRFFVPENVLELIVNFHYSPSVLSDEEMGKQVISEAVRFYDPDRAALDTGDIQSRWPLKNLLTVSIDDPNGFRGAAHRHRSAHKIEIKKKGSTPGFWNRSIDSGMWGVTISTHAIVTETCHYSITVQAVKAAEEEGRKRSRVPWRSSLRLMDIPDFDRSDVHDRAAHGEYRLVASELHCHTNHSDGKQTLSELATHAKKRGLEVVAMTDHNTTSPLQDRDDVQKKAGIRILNGMEWTTFYGHMLTLGYQTAEVTDWRLAGPTDIHREIKKIHSLGALVGIAHPFRYGNPLCTGCHWEYQVKNMSSFDYIEVWNYELPSVMRYNQKAFDFWTALLNKGYILPAFSGSDWHENKTPAPIVATSYVAMPKSLDESNEACFHQAYLTSMKEGRVIVSLGPIVRLTAAVGDRQMSVGDIVKTRQQAARFTSVMEPAETEHAIIEKSSFELHLTSNRGILVKGEYGDCHLEASRSLKGLTWVRAELYGTIDGKRLLLAFTNPIYFIEM